MGLARGTHVRQLLGLAGSQRGASPSPRCVHHKDTASAPWPGLSGAQVRQKLSSVACEQSRQDDLLSCRHSWCRKHLLSVATDIVPHVLEILTSAESLCGFVGSYTQAVLVVLPHYEEHTSLGAAASSR